MAPPKGHPRWGGRQKGQAALEARRREQEYREAIIAAALTPEQVAELRAC